MASCTYNCLMNVINIGNSIIGVSILAMPYCFRKCGILLSFVLMVISGLLTKLACFLILKSAVMARRRSFEFLAFHTFGTYGKLAVEMGVIGYLIGVCIAFFVVIGDLGPPLAAEFLNIENAPNLRTNVLMLVGICVALPLGLLRKIDSLTSLSALSIAFYACLILKIFAEAVPNLFENEWWYAVNWWRSEGILPCLPIFSMALSCQTQLFEFFDTTNEASLKRMQSVIDGAVCLCATVYLMVGMFGYIAFHDKNITGNILVLLTPSVVTEIIKLGFILTIAVSFPLCLFPCRSSLHSLIFKQGFGHHDLNVNTIPDHRFRILTISLVIVTIGIAIMLPNIEFVLGIIGSTIGTLICLILPAVIFIYDSNKLSSERRKAQILFGVGVFILIACTFSTLHENNNREPTVNIEVPKIENISPAPNLLLSSSSSPIVQLPKIVIKEPPVVQNEKKVVEVPELSIDEQKRLEPPVPQEPEIKNDHHADLDPQAIQKEDKELQKDVSHLAPKSVSPSKKDDGLEKQEKVLKQLEIQQQAQEQILEKQKEILEALRQHKETHDEIERKELLMEKHEVRKNEIISTPTVVKQENIQIIPVKNAVISDTLSVGKEILQDNKPKIKFDKRPEPNSVLSKNTSFEIVNLKKTKNTFNDIPKSEIKGLKDKEIVVPNNQYADGNRINNTIDSTKQNVQKIIRNLSISVNENEPNIVNLPSHDKDSVKLENLQNLKNSELHVKHRETLAKKYEFAITVSSLNNIDVHKVNAKDRT